MLLIFDQAIQQVVVIKFVVMILYFYNAGYTLRKQKFLESRNTG